MTKSEAAEKAVSKLAETLGMRAITRHSMPHLLVSDLDEGDDEWRYAVQIKMQPQSDKVTVGRDLYWQKVDAPLTTLLKAIYHHYLSTTTPFSEKTNEQ